MNARERAIVWHLEAAEFFGETARALESDASEARAAGVALAADDLTAMANDHHKLAWWHGVQAQHLTKVDVVQDDTRRRLCEADNVRAAERALEDGKAPRDRLDALLATWRPYDASADRARREAERRRQNEANHAPAKEVRFVKRPRTWKESVRPLTSAESRLLRTSLTSLGLKPAGSLWYKRLRVWYDFGASRYAAVVEKKPEPRKVDARDPVSLALSIFRQRSALMESLPPSTVKGVRDVR